MYCRGRLYSATFRALAHVFPRGRKSIHLGRIVAGARIIFQAFYGNFQMYDVYEGELVRNGFVRTVFQASDNHYLSDLDDNDKTS